MFLYKELGLEIDDILSRNCLNIFFHVSMLVTLHLNQRQTQNMQQHMMERQMITWKSDYE